MRAQLIGITKNNQTAVNLITNILVMGISMLISLWITPYLIAKLGLAAYGYVGVLNNLINFMTVLTYMLTAMVGRFLIVSLKKNGSPEASKYVSSALFTDLFLGALLLPLIFIFGRSLEEMIIIQKEHLIDVKISFILSSVAFILVSISQVFATGSYSVNRLDIRNGILIFSHIVRLAFLILMFSILKAQIWYVAFAAVMQGLISLILAAFSFKVVLPDVHFNIRFFNLHNSWELLSSGFLISIIVLGNNFLTQIDLIVGNRYLLPEVVGMYAAILLLPNSIRNIASAISSAFTPTTISLYSSGRMDELRKYSNWVVKLCGLLIGLPVAIISALSIPILRIWLGEDYSDYELTIFLMLLPLTLHLATNQLYNVQQATNKLKIPAFASIFFGVMNVLLAVYVTASLRMGIFGIVLSGVVMSTVRTFIFMPLYTAIITHQPKFAYYKGLIPPFLISLATFAAGILIEKCIAVDSIFSISCLAFGLSIIYFILSLGLLSHEERKSIRQKTIVLAKLK